MANEDEPTAWLLIRKDPPAQRGKKRIIHDRVFKTKAGAEAAAKRKSIFTQVFEAIAVYEK